MKTEIIKIDNESRLSVTYKNQVFLVKCDPIDVNYFKTNIDVMINRFKTDILSDYNDFLLKNGYTDTDIISEAPTALDQFLILDK